MFLVWNIVLLGLLGNSKVHARNHWVDSKRIERSNWEIRWQGHVSSVIYAFTENSNMLFLSNSLQLIAMVTKFWQWRIIMLLGDLRYRSILVHRTSKRISLGGRGIDRPNSTLRLLTLFRPVATKCCIKNGKNYHSFLTRFRF